MSSIDELLKTQRKTNRILLSILRTLNAKADAESDPDWDTDTPTDIHSLTGACRMVVDAYNNDSEPNLITFVYRHLADLDHGDR